MQQSLRLTEAALGAAKSVFVVFRAKPTTADKLASIEAVGNWTLSSDKQGRAVISASTNVSGTAVFALGQAFQFLGSARIVPVDLAAWGPVMVAGMLLEKYITGGLTFGALKG